MSARLTLGLTAEQQFERRKGIGGSDATILMGGDPAAIHHLWEIKTGKAEPEDLSRVLPVQMGLFTEPLNLYWFELTTGRIVTNEGEVRINKDYPFARCTLDGLTVLEDGRPAVVQAKHVNAFSKIDEVAQKYMPQTHHEMFVCGLDRAVLSVLIGTMTYEPVEITRDDWYLAQLIDREREFWACVESDTPPPGFEPVAAPALPTKFRTVSMDGNNAWASNAADWLANQKAAKTFETAAKEIKALVEADVGLATGHGIQAKRAKNGAITISVLKAAKEAA